MLWMILGMLAGCGNAQIKQNEGKMDLVVTSDIHYLHPDYYKDCVWFEDAMLKGDGKMVTYADEILEAFQKDMEKQKPQLVIITGDLTFYGEKESHRALAEKLKKLKEQGIAVAVLPGNHDIDSLFSRGYTNEDYYDVDHVDAEAFKEIYRELGYDQAIHCDENSLSYRLDLNEDFSLLMLDSVAHEQKGSSMDVGGFISDPSWEWLSNELADIRSSGRKAIAAMHHNLAFHFDLFNDGYTIADHDRLAALFHEYEVPFVLSGHMHCQHIAEINGVYDIASSSLLDAPLQYGVIHLDSRGMDYETRSLSIRTDANAYFDQVSANKLQDSYERIEDKRIREQMLEVLVKANRYFFAGNIADHLEELKQMEGYSYYHEKEGESLGFAKYYLDAMMQESDNHQSLHINFAP